MELSSLFPSVVWFHVQERFLVRHGHKFYALNGHVFHNGRKELFVVLCVSDLTSRLQMEP
jgi:hypothetical protein